MTSLATGLHQMTSLADRSSGERKKEQLSDLDADDSVVAIDLIILPDESARKRAILASAALRKHSADVPATKLFSLGESDRLPHVTLTQAFLERKQLAAIVADFAAGLAELRKTSKLDQHDFKALSVDCELCMLVLFVHLHNPCCFLAGPVFDGVQL
jgi:hypothetical protein